MSRFYLAVIAVLVSFPLLAGAAPVRLVDLPAEDGVSTPAGVTSGLGEALPVPPSGRPRGELRVAPQAFAASQVWLETTFADFADGTFDDAGAGAYVSGKGNVQVVDRRDFNQDGYFDLFFCNTDWDGVRPPSFIYWGGADGINPSRRSNLNAKWAIDSVSADFNDDGYADVFVSQWLDEWPNHVAPSYVWWGGAGGLGNSGTNAIINNAATGCATSDLNRDGYLDLIVATFPKYDYLPQETFLNIYWGAAGYTFSSARRTQLSTVGCVSVAVGDLNGDGHLDLIAAAEEETLDSNGEKTNARRGNVPSYIFWGDHGTYRADHVTLLNTYAAVGGTIADLDADGYLDVVIANHKTASHPNGLSTVFWGGADGTYGDHRHTDLDARGAVEASVADLDNDGHLDVLFCQFFFTPQHIYWGNGGRTFPSFTGLTPVENYGGFGATLADFDLDGRIDIGMTGYDWFGPLYTNDGQRFQTYNSGATYTSLEARGGHFTTATDVGHVAHRRTQYVYTSSVFETADSVDYRTIAWAAHLPPRTGLALAVRTATTRDGLQTAEWSEWFEASPADIPAGHDGRRWLQYRVRLASDNGADYPVLDEVALAYDTVPVTPAPTDTPAPTETPVADADGDGLADALEGYPPVAGQGNRWLPDSDGDGLLDGEEDADCDGVRDAGETDLRVRDSDGDGAWDGVEVLILGTNPLDPGSPPSWTDADRDGLPPGVDFDDADPDLDDDRIGDGYEWIKGGLEAMITFPLTPPLGDTSGDAAVSNLDALLTQALFLGTVHPGAAQTANGDVSRDGFVSNVDALMIQSYFLSVLAVLP